MSTMGTFIKLFLLALVVYFFITVYKTMKSLFGQGALLGDKTIPFSRAEECPSCNARIRVPEQPDSCPKCQTPLGRSPDGKLLIRVN
ncbi:MAG: hypothetical protein WD424_07445 [Paenibacillaceae bacterium]